MKLVVVLYFSKQRRIELFHVVILQRTTKKCTMIYNACAQLLLSLSLLFNNVVVAVMVFLKLRISIEHTDSAVAF